MKRSIVLVVAIAGCTDSFTGRYRQTSYLYASDVACDQAPTLGPVVYNYDFELRPSSAGGYDEISCDATGACSDQPDPQPWVRSGDALVGTSTTVQWSETFMGQPPCEIRYSTYSITHNAGRSLTLAWKLRSTLETTTADCSDPRGVAAALATSTDCALIQLGTADPY